MMCPGLPSQLSTILESLDAIIRESAAVDRTSRQGEGHAGGGKTFSDHLPFRAIERFLDVATREVVRTWIEQDVNDWRLNSHPPTWRLNKLNAPNSNWDIRANFPP
jgi:hypothetical protein